MIAYIDEQVRDNCWNLLDSYGEICVHCGCCSIDPKTKYMARVKCLEAWQAENAAFDMWAEDPEIREIQKHNIKKNAEHYKRLLRYYRQRLLKMGYVV